MKRKLWMILALAALAVLLCCGAASAEITTGSCGENVTWFLSADETTLTISGAGDMYDFYSMWDIPWYDFRGEIQTIIIESGVTSIGYNAFLDCFELTAVTIPNSVTAIGEMAFRGCFRLPGITIPSGIESIGDYAFRDCSALAVVKVLNYHTVFGNDVFRNCPENLKLRVLVNSTAEAYARQNSLTWSWISTSGNCGGNLRWSLNLATGRLTVTGTGGMYPEMDSGTFGEKDLIQAVVIGEGVTTIGANAFESCRNLRSVSIPNSVFEIYTSAFMGCSSLTSVTIPRNSVFIYQNAFSDCENLVSVVILGRDAIVYENQFENCSPNLAIYAWRNSSAHRSAIRHGLVFFPLDDVDLVLPADLTAIEADAFQDVSAVSVQIPVGVTSISGNPFAGSGVRFIYGTPGTTAETFANTYGYTFVPVTE